MFGKICNHDIQIRSQFKQTGELRSIQVSLQNIETSQIQLILLFCQAQIIIINKFNTSYPFIYLYLNIYLQRESIKRYLNKFVYRKNQCLRRATKDRIAIVNALFMALSLNRNTQRRMCIYMENKCIARCFVYTNIFIYSSSIYTLYLL